MVGVPSAALNRSYLVNASPLEQQHAKARTGGRVRSRRYFPQFSQRRTLGFGNHPKLGGLEEGAPRPHAYFFGTASTRAETAPFFSIPPRINGPSGVDRIPWLSARTSKVSSAIVSHRLPCTSKTKVT